MHLALNFQRVDPSRGGAETYVAELCRHLVCAGHRVDLYAETSAPGSVPSQVNLVPVTAHGRTRIERVWSFAKNSEAALSEARHDCSVGFINTYAHDVIIPQGGIHAASLDGNARRFKPEVVRRLYRLAKNANPKSWLYRAIEGRQYGAASAPVIVVPSNMVRRQIEEVHHVPRHQIHVVPNAIDPARLEAAQPGALRCAFRNRIGLEPGDLAGLFVGHNFALKGLRPLLTALGARRRRTPTARPIHLLVSGNGNAGPFQRMAKRLGIGATVHFLGYHPDIRACYRSSDFFVQPTYYDPCSLVVLEALACGLPVITTAQNGASELLTDGKQGYILTSPDSIGELNSALDVLAGDAQRHTMAAAARILGERQSFENHVSRLMSIFEQVAASRSRNAPHVVKRGTKTHLPHFEHSRRTRR
jgi:UDP-glucose:(heptosyl)LPS alpha-1,3-glucosyltransferase